MSEPEIVLIAAVAEENLVIGIDMRLPWHIPDDLKRFKKLTMGYPMIMGRKTFESLIHQFGKPLPGRRHLVLTSNPQRVTHPVAECFPDFESALSAASGAERVFVAGGRSVYAYALPRADRLELTIVEGSYEGDTTFPEYRHLVGPVFRLDAVEKGTGYRFETYRKVRELTE
jgi:dihydrofolate reductase